MSRILIFFLVNKKLNSRFNHCVSEPHVRWSTSIFNLSNQIGNIQFNPCNSSWRDFFYQLWPYSWIIVIDAITILLGLPLIPCWPKNRSVNLYFWRRKLLFTRTALDINAIIRIVVFISVADWDDDVVVCRGNPYKRLRFRFTFIWLIQFRSYITKKNEKLTWEIWSNQ